MNKVSFQDVNDLQGFLTLPDDADRLALSKLSGRLVILGAGGKMGPSLAIRAKRAAPHLDVVAVSRFADPVTREEFEAGGVRTLALDLLDPAAASHLPDADQVIYMAARKFGTAGDSSATWATNTVLAGLMASRYPKARIVAWSTGNVYPFTNVDAVFGGEDTATRPVGEYAWSAAARERVFAFYSQRNATPIVILRLNYAIDMRYGVLQDIAQRVWRGEPVPLAMGYFNCIWQGDANSVCLRSFDLCASPPAILNVTGPGRHSVREVALRFGELFARPVSFDGVEGETALLNNASRCHELFGLPSVSLEQMIQWTAAWIEAGHPTYGKPTHFEVRDGQF
jgi:nucleoside-diphosphate-sugar epimerase